MVRIPQFKTQTQTELEQTKTKIRGNVSRMLDFLNKCLGSPEYPNHQMDKVYVYEMYVIFTHAVEEYGKLLYLETLQSDVNGNYVIEYRDKFRNHNLKFNLALANLPDSIKTVHLGGFTSSGFTSSGFTTDTEPNWDNRLTVLNVDIDDNNKATDIDFHVDIDELRKSVWDFRNFSY